MMYRTFKRHARRLLIALLLPALLCPAALADAQNQLNTPGTFQAEYSSNSGRTKITVDATVYVPEVMYLNTGGQTQIHACSSIKGETLAIQTSLEKRSRGSS